ncbi:hypothetical protein Tco_0098518 [Tanacetum coccineum]
MVHDKKPGLTFFRVFGALRYPINDIEDLGKLQPTADIGIFISYAPSRKGYRIYNKRTQQIMETFGTGTVRDPIRINPRPIERDVAQLGSHGDPLRIDSGTTEQMATVQLSTGPAPSFFTLGLISSGLVPNPVLAAPYHQFNSAGVHLHLAIMIARCTFSSVKFTPDHRRMQYNLQVYITGVVADSTLIEDNPFAIVDNHPFINVFALEPSSEASSSGDLSSSKSPYVSQTLINLGDGNHWIIYWNFTIGRYPPEKQLATIAFWCLFKTLYY